MKNRRQGVSSERQGDSEAGGKVRAIKTHSGVMVVGNQAYWGDESGSIHTAPVIEPINPKSRNGVSQIEIVQEPGKEAQYRLPA